MRVVQHVFSRGAVYRWRGGSSRKPGKRTRADCDQRENAGTFPRRAPAHVAATCQSAGEGQVDAEQYHRDRYEACRLRRVA